MKKLLLTFCALAAFASTLPAQASVVKTVQDEKGWRLQVDDENFAVKGIVWSYTPVGENYTYNLFSQPEAFITRTIDTDMTLLKAMGVNAIRCFSTIPPQWVEYIYDRYGIFTMINDLFGRYGITVDGRWQMPTDYSSPATRRTLLAQARKTFETYKDTRGVLLYMLGNESNYGLEWTSAAIENLPGGEQNDFKAKALYSLFEEAFQIGKSIDPNHPMGLVNGDLQYMRVMKDLVPSLDILGVNTYRGGQSFDGFYQSIAKDLGKPFLYTEFGADAYNVATEQEDQDAQAKLVISQWKELYGQAYGKGKSGNVLGGFVFEWMDEWWKAGMETGLTVHDTNGTWSNGGYTFDAIPGRNNMNEEWFGIVGQSLKTVEGVPRRLPRTAYYALKDLWRLDLYTSTKDQVSKTFGGLDFAFASSQGNLAQLKDNTTDPHPLFTLHGKLTSRTWLFSDDVGWAATGRASLTPANLTTGFFGAEVKGIEGFAGSVLFRALPKYRPFDTKTQVVDPPEGAAATESVPSYDTSVDPIVLSGPVTAYKNQFELYQGSLTYTNPAVSASVHYHDGHPDWAAEGDFFGLMPETYDMVRMDKDGSKAPFGVELTFPETVPGLKVYGGPEVFWGAKPQVLSKYSRAFGWLGLNLIHDEELSAREKPVADTDKTPDRWTSASLDFTFPHLTVQTGALLARYNRVNNPDHTYTKPVDGLTTAGNRFTLADSTAGKVRVTSDFLPYLKVTLQYLYAGLLADTRGAIPREGSQIYDVGTGNRSEFLGTVQAVYGDFVLRSTLLARKPLVDALDRSALTSVLFVGENRETLAGEAVLTWDTTGATYFHDWNNDDREDSPLAASLGLLYYFHQGPTDRYKLDTTGTGIWAVYPAGKAAADGDWSLKGRIAGRPFPGTKLVLNAALGKLQDTASDASNTRPVAYTVVSGQASWDRFILEGSWAKDNWGPYDWHREQNITYPLQYSVGLAYSLQPVSFLKDDNRIGVRFSTRTIDTYATADDQSGGVQSRSTAELYAGWTF